MLEWRRRKIGNRVSYENFAMQDFLQNNESLLWILGIISIVTFLATLVIVPWIIVRLPEGYFATPQRIAFVSNALHPSVRIVLLLCKNTLGIFVVVLGIAMLVIPGQGLLTILIGLILIDFPGKYTFQRWLVKRKPVLKSINWLRKRGDRKPLRFDLG